MPRFRPRFAAALLTTALALPLHARAQTSNLPGFADIVDGKLEVTAAALRASMRMASLPASFDVNQSHALEGYNEYLWGLHLDMDGDGGFTAGDMLFWVWHPKVAGALPSTLPLSQFSMHLRAMEGNSANFKADIAGNISIGADSIVFDVPRSAYAGLAAVTPGTRYRFYTYYNAPTGGMNDYFAGTATLVPDGTPDAFAFAAATDVAPEESVESGKIVVRGINMDIPVAITGGEYSLNGGTWTSVPGTVALGNEIRVRLAAPASYGAVAAATLTLGGVSASFAVTTRAYTRVSATTQVFSNPQTAELTDDGTVRFRAVPTEPLVLAADAAESAVVRIDDRQGVAVVAAGATLVYTPESSSTRFQVRTIAGEKSLEVSSGRANVAAAAAGSVIPVVAGSAVDVALVTQAADTQATVGRDARRELVAAVAAGSALYRQTTSGGGTAADDFRVHAGEAMRLDDTGALRQVRFGSATQDRGQLGDYFAALPLAAATLSVPRIVGASARFGEAVERRVARALAARLGLSTVGASLSQDETSGVISLVTSQGRYRFLPIGALGIDAAANLTAVVAEGLAFAVAPATSYEDLAVLLRQIDPAATLEILADGAVEASFSGARFSAQPASLVEPGGTPGPAFDMVEGQVVLRDSAGNRQTLYPAFANTDYLVSTFAAALPGLAVANNGAGLYAASQSGASYALSPDIVLAAPPAAQAGNQWWIDSASGKFFIRYGNGFCQAFGVQ